MRCDVTAWIKQGKFAIIWDYVDSDTARVTFQTPGSLEQKSLLQKITNDLKMFSIQTTKKDLNRLKG